MAKNKLYKVGIKVKGEYKLTNVCSIRTTSIKEAKNTYKEFSSFKDIVKNTKPSNIVAIYCYDLEG